MRFNLSNIVFSTLRFWKKKQKSNWQRSIKMHCTKISLQLSDSSTALLLASQYASCKQACITNSKLLTCVTLFFMVGERCLRVVVVAIVVVVSMIVVDISASGVVEVVSVVSTEGTSPTSRRLPWVCTLGSPSAANLSTCRPL